MSTKTEETATCRRCGCILRGKPYWAGGDAYVPRTGQRAKVNYYGGYVCSRECDYRASLELEQTMPGHGYNQTSIGSFAREHFNQNWEEAP